MKSIFAGFWNFRLALALSLSVFTGSAAWAKSFGPSIVFSPNPLVTGLPFVITVTASSNVTQVTATVDFKSVQSASLDITLTNQGSVWTGSGLVPSDLIPKHIHQDDADVDAKAKVVLLDSMGRQDVEVIKLDVTAPTISAVFGGGVLTVIGDDQDNTFVVSRDTTGTLLVNGGAVPITGGVPTIANTTLIQMFGLKGNDVLTVDDSNGPMPPANLFGGEGDDILTGSASDDMLDGGPGNDTLDGRSGNDRLLGGPGNDILIGGRGNDFIDGGDGDDLIIWNPGDGSDIVEGGTGNDTLVFNGANIAETIDLSANGSRLRFFRNVAAITMDCDGIEKVSFKALGGADQITVNDLTATAVNQVVLDLSVNGGGDGAADTVIINGTTGDDHVTVTGLGSETDVLGGHTAVSILGTEQALDQLFINAAGGSDTVDFVGSNTNEFVAFSPNGAHLLFSDNMANMSVDCTGFQTVNFHALGNADQITVNDLTGTEATKVGIDLSNVQAGTGGGRSEVVTINGTAGDDHIILAGSAAQVDVTGLTAAVSIIGGESGLDNLIVNALGGADIVDASAVQAGAISLTLNGGDGNDLLIGGQGNDVMNGGRGNDVEFGGAGDDVFLWNPGDGSDTIEGQGGVNTMIFNGANIAEQMDLSANGRRLRFFRDVGNVTMDCDGVDVVKVAALGGADLITINDLSGTRVTTIDLDLASPPGSGNGDGLADTVIINGTETNDVVTVNGTPATGVNVLGLAATVSITGADPTLDQLIVNLGDGDDAFVATDLQAGVIKLTVDGGKGDDVIIGSAGADVLLGGEGDDFINGGPGFDVIDGGTGNNVIIQD
jgi:Ca2+-binding RTX toxin-like protein